MKTRFMFLLLPLLILFSSCSSGDEAYIIASDTHADVIIFSKNEMTVFSQDEESLKKIEKISGMSSADALSALFPYAECSSISESEKERNDYLFSLLENISSSDDDIMNLFLYKKDLKNTEFVNKLSGLYSHALDRMLAVKKVNRLSLDVVLSYNASWQETIEFVSYWLESGN
ncbi:MAG TPA: hypothetical protein IAB12_07065 [Candidatus Ornithospirochaeta avicola]|uniref:Uncharacterized protein n=1 Tax=Candidatus Ornithospirochaeta avicola TaxID=2840896 RepID=A0A9D1PVT1_9SPIO|nr:hypothetical protein [Candidatus Ornithospirochaeta avicola]